MLGQSMAGMRVLDLFAGTGALGLEALSRGAAWVDFVEQNPRMCSAIRDSLRRLNYADQASVFAARVERAPAILSGSYKVIFMDPPYALPQLEEVLEHVAASHLVERGTILVLEHSRHVEPEDRYGPLVLDRRRRYGETVISIYVTV
jgi:16S rRNA (guanine966-N2)-methyltransferase